MRKQPGIGDREDQGWPPWVLRYWCLVSAEQQGSHCQSLGGEGRVGVHIALLLPSSFLLVTLTGNQRARESLEAAHGGQSPGREEEGDLEGQME